MSAAGAIGASVTNPSPLAATMLEELQKAYAPYPAIVSAEAIKRGEALVERWAAKQDALERKVNDAVMWLEAVNMLDPEISGDNPPEIEDWPKLAVDVYWAMRTGALKALRDGRVSEKPGDATEDALVKLSRMVKEGGPIALEVLLKSCELWRDPEGEG